MKKPLIIVVSLLVLCGSAQASLKNGADYIDFVAAENYNLVFLQGFEVHVHKLEFLDDDRLRTQTLQKLSDQLRLALGCCLNG